ncbi:YqaJ viral recombinase family protein [Pseudobutyrivibrio xylanivorans]|uniref:YqaJ viral recombinase domain-containing protein n=1 Tax=Pseudobutyrivibrio xylanivorans TaxID=185007 RepID=A0A5P6VU04_PSEXY|nr:YqaJ viral recombinase family protein [Pseudobutyrivibrio xylanivorans]QFJ54331.1 hypothetical protein FXF36_05420 [Pseudobutyrivibrio xylanivorans]
MNVNILVETNNLTREEWLNYRRQGIGGSDVSALLGINKWKSELELWLDKVGQSKDDFNDNEAIQWGSLLEPIIRKHFAEVTGKNVKEVKAILQHPAYKFMLADVDGITEDDDHNPAILEIKTASEFKRGEWENDVPTYYQTQVQHYLFVTGLKKAYVAVLIGGNTFKIFEVEADEHIQDMLVSVEKNFWDKVISGTRPEVDGSDAAKSFLDNLYDGGITEEVVLPEEVNQYVNSYVEACMQEDEAKSLKQEAANHIKEYMGNNEKATCLNHVISWQTVTTDRLDTKALKQDKPEVYASYVKTSSSRRFMVK